MIDALPLLLAPEGYQISRSVRLRSSANASFTRTPASAGNRKTWTISLWVKRGALNAAQSLWYVGSASTYFNQCYFDANNNLVWFERVSGGAGSGGLFTTTPVYRDPSSWYHLVFTWDTTQAAQADRMKIYVNNVLQSGTWTTYPTLNYDGWFNTALLTYLGGHFSGTQSLDGYLTEVNFIDGQALTPSSFGETDTITGVWKPKKYTGTYGTNGFYLNFSDNSAATAAAIGKDSSGNGNNWTPNNISVTAGATYDSMLDVPTMWADGGNGRGNYAVLNPLSSNASMTITGGNLNVTSSVASQGFNAYSSFAVLTGKYYVEATVNTGADADMIGVCPSTLLASSGRFDGLAGGVGYYRDGRKFIAGVATAYGASYTTGDVIGIALDMDAQTVAFYKNGVSQGTISSSLTSGIAYYFVTGDASGGTGINQSWNFGQRPFSYTPPSGFKALNTQNLPTPTILKGNQYFNAVTYAGNNSSRVITGLGFQPDLLWFKARATAYSHALVDAVRGRSKVLQPNLTSAEATTTSASNDVVSFDADGFTLGPAEISSSINNDSSIVSWAWKESAQAGFDIVTYTGNGASNRAIAHGLGVAPKMYIIKNRTTGSTNWNVWFTGFTSNEYLLLNTTGAKASFAGQWGSLPTSSDFYVGSSSGINANGDSMVAYLFAEVAGFSKFGSYTGNGSADGPFVFCGFRPRFVMIKRTDTAGYNWTLYDSARDTFNAIDSILYPNLSNAENSGTARFDFLSNGFKARDASNDNASGGTYIFAAFAENPFKNSLAR